MQLSKTWQTYEVGDLVESSKIYGRSGMMQSGTCYQLQPLVRLTEGIESGLLPTPLASAKVDCPSERRRDSPHLETIVKMLPTPTASDATVGNVIGKHDTFKITKNGNIRKHNQNGTSGSLGLARYVKFFPTPMARDYKDTGSIEKLAQYAHKKRLMPVLASQELITGDKSQ